MLHRRLTCKRLQRLLPALVVALGCCAMPVTAAAAAAGAPMRGARNPAADCDPAGAAPQLTLAGIDRCRAGEGVGALTLPSNFAQLSAAEQLFVLVDLERVNRGLAPIAGLSPALNALALAGAYAGTDPSFPAHGFTGGGSVWFGGGSGSGSSGSGSGGGTFGDGGAAIAADYGWMYDDGPNGLDLNADCSRAHPSLCWLHRDIILWRGTGGPLVAGGGSARGSQAFELLSGYRDSGLSFTWAHELRYFRRSPGLEPLAPHGRFAQGLRRVRRHRHRRARAARRHAAR